MNKINKKGFTLIETLMVIALIGMISLILVPNVINIINKNKVKSCENQKKNIISATKIYVNENKYDLGFTCGSKKNIEVQDLIDAGKLSSDMNDESLPNKLVEVTFNCETKQFQYVFEYECE